MSQTTDCIYIFDRSGSMANVMNEAIGAFNSFLAEQKALPGEMYLTLIVFDDKVDTIYFREPIQKCEPITSETVFARGTTALNDAVGQTISKFQDDWHVITLIQTDGFENCSKEFTKELLAKLVTQKEQAGWKFEFVGAGDLNLQQQGLNLGINPNSVYSVAASAEGYGKLSAAFSASTRSYRGA